jgi:general secretion pathway protein G
VNSLTSLHPSLHSPHGGFTLLELMFGLCAVGLVLAIGMPTYRDIIERQQVARAVRDLGGIAQQLERYKTTHSFRLPAALSDVGSVPKDPWGRDYRYLNFTDDGSSGEDKDKNEGKVRKDHNLHPLNSAFDLYSVGPDGDSRAPLTAKASRDDIIFARDGAFIGRASEF